MPLPAGRQANPFSMVGKPLPTSLLSGVPVHVVAARLGHADPAVTLRVYAHVMRTAEAAAADIFAKSIGTSIDLFDRKLNAGIRG